MNPSSLKKAVLRLGALVLASWMVTHVYGCSEAMRLAKEYGHVRKGAINAPEVRIMTAEGAEKLIPYLHRVPDLYRVGIFTVALTPDQLRDISKLRSVDRLAIGGELTDEDVAMLSGMTWVDALDLSYNPITDEALDHIAKMKSIRVLRLVGTKIEGHNLGVLGQLNHLEQIDLGVTSVNDQTVGELKKLPRLREVSLSNTNISAEGLMQLADLHWLQQVALPEERVYGKATHKEMPQHRERVQRIWSQFNALKRKKYQESKDRGEDVPDEFVSPFPDKLWE